MAHDSQAVPVGVEPPSEPRPFANQRLVSHFDRGFAGHRVVIKREEPGIAVCGDDVRRDRRDLRTTDPATGVLGALAGQHQAPEESTYVLPARFAVALVELIGAASDRAAQTPVALIGGEREFVAVPIVDHVGQLVLDKRQACRCAGRVGYQGGDEARLDCEAHSSGRAGDGALELGGAQGGHGDRVGLHQVADEAMAEGPIVEVGPDRDHNPDPTGIIDRGRGDRAQELVAFRLVGHCEELFELIDDQYELRGSVREAASGGLDQPAADPQRVLRCLRMRGRCDLEQRPGQLRHRVLPGDPSRPHTRRQHVVEEPSRLAPPTISPTPKARRPRGSEIVWRDRAIGRRARRARRSPRHRPRQTPRAPCTGCVRPVPVNCGRESPAGAFAARTARTRSPISWKRSFGSGAVARCITPSRASLRSGRTSVSFVARPLAWPR